MLHLTKGLLFFGIPYAGLRTEELEKALSDIDAEKNADEQEWRKDMRQLLHQLERNSDYLEQLRCDVTAMLSGLKRRVEITSFYENVRTNTTRTVGLMASTSSIFLDSLIAKGCQWPLTARRSQGSAG